MAVFTKVSLEQVASAAENLPIGKLLELREIASGIENTNYFLDTDLDGEVRHWVLTIFEQIPKEELPYFSALTQHLSVEGFNVPAPVSDAGGHALIEVAGKPAVIVPRLAGACVNEPEVAHCHEVGKWLAGMHIKCTTFPLGRSLVRDLEWLDQHYQSLSETIEKTERLALLEGINRYRGYKKHLDLCPQGTVHGDLFRDNVLFEDTKVSGVIDFYNACDATLLYDLAIVANDWAFDMETGYDSERMHAIVQGYQELRVWTDAERLAWRYCLELAALRFWVSRLASKYGDGYQQAAISGDTLKDPGEMFKRYVSAQTAKLEDIGL